MPEHVQTNIILEERHSAKRGNLSVQITSYAIQERNQAFALFFPFFFMPL